MLSHRRQPLARLVAFAVASAAAALPGAAAAAPPPVPAEAFASAGTREAWYELRLPSGPPQGIVLAFHGGGWVSVGPGNVRGLSGYRGGELHRRWRARGFITVTSTYRANEASFTDVVSVYDQLHARYPQLPIGAYGQSAGAHLALLLGAARALAFVVSDAGPTDWATWKSAYPCFHRTCAAVAPPIAGRPVTGVGAYWVDVNVAGVFGAASDPAPNLDDYDAAPNYDANRGPDPFLIYGRRAQPFDPLKIQIGDRTPSDGPLGNAYIDSDSDPATVADRLEADSLVTQQQGTLLLDRVGPRGVLRTLPTGPVPWVHGTVDGATAAAVYDEMIDWTAARAAASAPAPAVAGRPNAGLANLGGLPTGAYAVRACNATPARSGVFTTGAWTPSVSDVAGLDAAESGCSTGLSATGAGEGMQMRTEPSATGPIAQGAATAMTFRAPPGTTISSYGASYHGARAAGGWEMSLVARDGAGTPTTLAQCPAAAPCATRADDFVSPATTDATNGPYPPQTFDVPAGTVALTWQLACRASGGCAGGSSGNAAHLHQQAFLNVYASAVYVSDPDAPPAAALTGDFGDAAPHGGPLNGTVLAGDAGAGVRRVEMTFAGRTQAAEPACDYSRPRPCPATATLAVSADTAGLAEGPQPVAVTVTDGSGRSTTTAGSVTVQNVPRPEPTLDIVAPAPLQRRDPFASGSGLAQLASCSDGPVVIAATLARQRLRVTAVAAQRLAGRRATLKVRGRALASAAVRSDGIVRVRRRLGRTQLASTFVISAGGRSSAPLPVRALLTLAARRAGDRITFSGAVRRGGRRVRIQQLVACGRWRTVATVNSTMSRSFQTTVAAAGPAGGAYRARVAAPRSPGRSGGSQATSAVAVL